MKKNNRITVYLPIILSIAIIAGMLIGIRLSEKPAKERFFIYPRTDKLTNIVNYIVEQYVDTVAKNELEVDAIIAMLKTLDPHSLYIPAKELERLNEPLRGNFFGIGIQFNMQNDTVIVINTIPNGPSEIVGLLPGDRIVTVNDTNVAGVKMSSNDIVSRLKGPKGTIVHVGIKRKKVKNLLEFEITRDKIPLYSLDIAYMLNDEIGYIKISQFSRTTFDEFLMAIEKLEAQNFKKLIFDLRGNGGGYMDAATNIADQFLNDRELIVYTKGKARPRSNIYASPRGVCLDKEVIILLDELSASASEILAGAIQDNDRGLIIGRRSYGKGLVQEQMTLNDGSAIRLTIARYYTPTGRCIQKPYDNGTEDYYNEINDRYVHGEFIQADSIHFADSLKYITPEGNVVYGGGGIMPDIFIPLDTSNITPYYNKVKSKALLYKFAFEYTDEHREKLSNYQDYKKLVKYLKNQKLMDQFIQYAKDKGITPDYIQIRKSGEIMRLQINAYISRNIFDNEGFYPILNESDVTVQKAVEIFSN